MEKTKDKRGKTPKQIETKPNLKSQFNPNYKGVYFDNTPGKKITQPDQSLTIEELLRNHTRGIGVDQHYRNGEFFEDVEIPRFTDLTDIENHKNELIKQKEDLDQIIKEEKKANKALREKKIREKQQSTKAKEKTPETPPKTSESTQSSEG
jgi:hypothetical protein